MNLGVEICCDITDSSTVVYVGGLLLECDFDHIDYKPISRRFFLHGCDLSHTVNFPPRFAVYWR